MHGDRKKLTDAVVAEHRNLVIWKVQGQARHGQAA